jgi:hypothetical protein
VYTPQAGDILAVICNGYVTRLMVGQMRNTKVVFVGLISQSMQKKSYLFVANCMTCDIDICCGVTD